MSENDIEYITMVLERMIVEEKIRFYLKFKVVNIGTDAVVAENIENNNSFKIKCDIVVNATGFEVPYDELKSLTDIYKNSYIIGDCYRPGNLFNAVTQAYEVAKKV